MLNKILAMILFASPFLMGYGIFSLLNPIGFWETLVCFIVSVILCFFEGLIAWVIGYAILVSD